MLEWNCVGRHERKMMETMNIIFNGHEKLLNFLFEHNRPKLRQEASLLLQAACGFSSGEQLLIRVGIDLWNGEADVKLWELVERLDENNFEQIFKALLYLKKSEDDGMIWRSPGSVILK
jgi:hypothetical protein